MKQKEYNIATRRGVKKVKGEPITVQGRKCAFILIEGAYRLMDLLLGMNLISNTPLDLILMTKEWNKQKLLCRMKDSKHVITDKIIEGGKKELKKAHIKYPVNEI